LTAVSREEVTALPGDCEKETEDAGDAALSLAKTSLGGAARPKVGRENAGRGTSFDGAVSRTRATAMGASYSRARFLTGDDGNADADDNAATTGGFAASFSSEYAGFGFASLLRATGRCRRSSS
jgi:hypothetical protein